MSGHAAPSNHVSPPARAAYGFTLLELLFTVLVLAIVGSGAVMLTSSAHERACEKMVEREIREVRRAILRFEEDTGFALKAGPFALESEGGEVPVPDQGAQWFHHPANLSQLFEMPRDGSGQPIMPWSIDTGRGWRGPYLTVGGEGLVDLGAGLLPDGSGSPLAGGLLFSIPAVADPFVRRPVGAFMRWHARVSGAPLSERGAPYMLFAHEDRDRARLVSLGPNGLYESEDPTQPGDDIVLHLHR